MLLTMSDNLILYTRAPKFVAGHCIQRRWPWKLRNVMLPLSFNRFNSDLKHWDQRHSHWVLIVIIIVLRLTYHKLAWNCTETRLRDISGSFDHSMSEDLEKVDNSAIVQWISGPISLLAAEIDYTPLFTAEKRAYNWQTVHTWPQTFIDY